MENRSGTVGKKTTGRWIAMGLRPDDSATCLEQLLGRRGWHVGVVKAGENAVLSRWGFEYSGNLSGLGKTGMSETPGTWAAYLSILPWHFDWGRRRVVSCSGIQD